MEKASGRYKRHTQLVALALGFVLSVALAQGYAAVPPAGNAGQDFKALLDTVQENVPPERRFADRLERAYRPGRLKDLINTRATLKPQK